MGESFQKLNLTNAYLFAAALQDEEICRNLLEIVLNKEIPRVKAHAEHTLFLDSDFKSVRFDVYASDEDEVMMWRCRMTMQGICPSAAGTIRGRWMSHP